MDDDLRGRVEAMEQWIEALRTRTHDLADDQQAALLTKAVMDVHVAQIKAGMEEIKTAVTEGFKQINGRLREVEGKTREIDTRCEERGKNCGTVALTWPRVGLLVLALLAVGALIGFDRLVALASVVK